MNNINILNKVGMLTDVDRKAPLTHTCQYLTFKSCIDLSQPIKVYGTRKQFTASQYSQDVASFICWWSQFIYKDLNGFIGFPYVKFELVDFTLIEETQSDKDAELNKKHAEIYMEEKKNNFKFK